MIINVFKDHRFWQKLQKHTKELVNAVKDYDFTAKGKSPWFDPKVFREYPLTTDPADGYGKSPVTHHPKFQLLLYCANYPAIRVIDTLYKENKDILIEDYACGATYFAYYLSKLGFNYYSFIENFSQVRKELFDIVTTKSDVDYTLNDLTVKPTVVNIVGYPWYEKEIPDAELFCIYPCDNMFKTVIATLEKRGYKELCHDSDGLLYFYCKERYLEEWQKKLSYLG